MPRGDRVVLDRQVAGLGAAQDQRLAAFDLEVATAGDRLQDGDARGDVGQLHAAHDVGHDVRQRGGGAGRPAGAREAADLGAHLLQGARAQRKHQGCRRQRRAHHDHQRHRVVHAAAGRALGDGLKGDAEFAQRTDQFARVDGEEHALRVLAQEGIDADHGVALVEQGPTAVAGAELGVVLDRARVERARFRALHVGGVHA